MNSDIGWEFDNLSTSDGSSNRSISFGNAANATISAGLVLSNGVGGSNVVVLNSGFEFSSVIVAASNVFNAGTLTGGFNGYLSVDGDNLNLKNGTMNIQGGSIAGNLGILGFGVFIDYWGLGIQTNLFAGGNYNLAAASSPEFRAVTTTGSGFVILNPANAIGALNITQPNASNDVYEYVIVGTTNPAVVPSVGFLDAGGGFTIPIVQYAAAATNLSGNLTTNYIYIEDTFGAYTNYGLYTNYFDKTGVIPYLIASNYNVFTSDQPVFTLAQGNSTYDPTLLNAVGKLTNEYSAMGLTFSDTTYTITQAGQTYANSPGRVMLNADKYLDLTGSTISGDNYLSLTATNHFKGSAGASISAPFMDFNLGSTNGLLSVSNLISPYFTTIIGNIGVYSARWTNVVTNVTFGATNVVTNNFHVMMVDGQLNNTAPAEVLNLTLRSTNVVINDVVNVNSNLAVSANSLVIGPNTSGLPPGYGILNVLNTDDLWAESFPTLEYLTNWGLINFPGEVNGGYINFINHGSILDSDVAFTCNDFENTGGTLTISNPGAVPLTSISNALLYSAATITITTSNALMTNDTMTGAGINADVSITAFNLTNMQHIFNVSGMLTLTVSNNLTDGGYGASNVYNVTDGFNLPVKPTLGDLLGTTVTNVCAGARVDNTWAGTDRKGNPTGFLNNSAVGQMVFDAKTGNSVFYYHGPDTATNYALYVGQIVLLDYATNRNNNGGGAAVFSAFNVDANVTIYFGKALVGTNDVSGKLNGANNGRFVWLPAYSGIYGPSNPIVQLSTQTRVVPTVVSGKTVPSVTYYAPAWSSSYLQYTTNIMHPNWTTFTNFTETNGTNTYVTIVDKGRTNSPVFYRVQYSP
jgi:hypothetical protein